MTALSQQTEQLLEIFSERRSIYGLSKEMPITEEQAIKLIKAAVKSAPSAYDAKTTRVCILLGKHHDTFWNLTKAALFKVTSQEHAAQGAGKIEACFQSGCGTVLFFEDERAAQAMLEDLPAVHEEREAVLQGLAHSNCAAAQYAVWNVLAQAGLGCTLQHYQNLVAEPVRKAFQIPPWWSLNAMMPFGGPAAPVQPKESSPMEARFLVKDEDGLSTYGGNGSSREGESRSAGSR